MKDTPKSAKSTPLYFIGDSGSRHGSGTFNYLARSAGPCPLAVEMLGPCTSQRWARDSPGCTHRHRDSQHASPDGQYDTFGQRQSYDLPPRRAHGQNGLPSACAATLNAPAAGWPHSRTRSAAPSRTLPAGCSGCSHIPLSFLPHRHPRAPRRWIASADSGSRPPSSSRDNPSRAASSRAAPPSAAAPPRQWMPPDAAALLAGCRQRDSPETAAVDSRNPFSPHRAAKETVRRGRRWLRRRFRQAPPVVRR